jgi:VanZ family protein
MTNRLRLRLLVSYLLALGFLSLNPWLLPDSHRAFDLMVTWDLIDHTVAYALLTVLLLSVVPRGRKRRFRIIALAVLASSAIGLSIEFGQYWLTSTRQFSWHDAYANAIGSFIGALLFWVCAKVAVWRDVAFGA